MATKTYAHIGEKRPKVDGMNKALGITQYTDDIHLPRMAYGKLLRSTEAHARVLSVDTTAAEKLPGVYAVITGKSVPTQFGIMPTSQDEHALAVDKVRYVGDPVAAVAAVDEETAQAACELIQVTYERLEPVFSIEQAVTTATDAEDRIHEDFGDGGNIHKIVALEFGDVEAAFASADFVDEGLYFYEGNTHLPMEQHCAVAHYDPEGKLTLWSATQTPHYVQRALARVLELPAHRIRVLAPPTGGGFGGKDDPFSHEIVAAKLSMAIGRPVKFTFTREEVFYTHRGRHPVLMECKTGWKHDGTLTGMAFKTFLDGGAHGSYGPASTYYTGALQTVTYKVPAYKFESVRAFTNKPPCGPKRGHGTPQPRFALEIVMDKVAQRLGVDPVELRLKNLIDSHSLTVNWLQITSCGLGECLEKAREASGFSSKHGKLPHGKGIGIAAGSYICGAGMPIYWNDLPHSEVHIRVDRMGTVTAYSGSVDIGQGSDTVLATIVAEVLGLEPQQIDLVTADTDLTPIDLGSYSSRVTMMMGNAAKQAAERLREQILTAVGQRLGVPSERLRMRDGHVVDAQSAEVDLSFREAAEVAEGQRQSALVSTGSYRPPRKMGHYKGSGVGPSPAYSYSVCAAEVTVDPETAELTVEKIWMAHDIGECINETLVIGQVEGGIYMGLGEALMEEYPYRTKLGTHKIPSLLDYKSPTANDMPPVETILVKDPESRGPFGAKEVGQGPLLPVMPAIANAVYDAVGVRIDEVPITAEKILAALEQKAKGKEGRVGPNSLPKITFPPAIKVDPPDEWKGKLSGL